jgi:hypothetical protein
MLAKDFSAERIADILEIAVVEVEAIEQEITIKTYFQKAWTIEKVVEQFDETEQTLLFSATQLIKLHQEVAVEQLLTEELSVQEIMEKLDLTEIFVKSIQKMMKK